MLRPKDSLVFRSLLLVSAATLVGCFETPEDPEDADPTTSAGDSTSSATTDPATTDPATTDPDTTGEPVTDSSGEPATDSTGTPTVCGDGTVDADEVCDDGNTDDGDGCDATCAVDRGWECDGASPSICTTICGDGVVAAPAEECDDMNKVDSDECTNACLNATCGDGVVWIDNEVCDDGGTDAGDGCSDSCEWETGFVCEGVPSSCFRAAFLADGTGGTQGSLWAMSLDGVTTLDLGPLTISGMGGGVGLTGMAFHPNGTLYGVSSSADVNGGQLGRIDIATTEFTIIGPLQDVEGVSHGQMPDIAFMGEQLIGWTERGDDLALIDSATALVTPITSDRSSFGTAMGYNSASDTIVLAPDGSGGFLYFIDEMGGVVQGPSITGISGNVRGMSFYDGLFYGMDVGFGGVRLGGGGGGGGDFVTFDPATGATTPLAPVPSFSLDALAVFDPANTP